jgi:hypothetical protein
MFLFDWSARGQQRCELGIGGLPPCGLLRMRAWGQEQKERRASNGSAR